MKEFSQSIRQTLYRNHPRAYFLIGSVMHRASDKNWETLTEKIEIEDEERVNKALHWQIKYSDRERAKDSAEGDRESAKRFQQNHRFAFFGYKQVQAEISPTLFACRKCGYAISLRKKIIDDKLIQSDLFCPKCKIALRQVVHVFGHPSCGEIVEIEPEKCPECKKPMHLMIDSAAFGRTDWICPDGHGGRLHLAKTCPFCGSLGKKEIGMTPYAAGSVVKPVFISMVDIKTNVDWEDVARERLELKQESLRQLIRKQYDKNPLVLAAVENYLDSSETKRKEMYEEFLGSHPEHRGIQGDLITAIGGEPEFNIKRSLSEYRGVEQAMGVSPADPIDPRLKSLILKKFHLTPRYIAKLPILEIVYGYQVGTSDLKKGKVRTFDKSGWESIALACRTETEAALFDLDQSALTLWIGKTLGANIDIASLNKTLIHPEASSPKGKAVYDQIESVLHTIAHLMIRQSELYTGLSRESLSEIIFPAASAFAIYCVDGSELGAIHSAFSSYRLIEWLRQSLLASQECAHDPVCGEGRITGAAACHACLFIAERNCNGYWNGKLDRKLVSNAGRNNGFWDQ